MSPEERVLALLDYEPCADTFTWEVPQDMRLRITDAIRAAVAEERERCAKIAEAKAVFHRDNCHKSCACADGWHIAMAIRATGTTAAYRDALASAAAHFGGAPVPTGAPTVADALASGSRALRDMASGTTAADLGGES